MPPSALDLLASLHIDYPMLFELQNASTYSGFPTVGRWSSSQKKKAQCTCLTGLETTLRNFSCLRTGDSIMVAYNNRKYYIDIIETKPSNAVSFIETECEVDFAPPLDYKEAEKPAVSIPTGKPLAEGREPPDETGPKFNPFTGVASWLDGKPLITQPAPVTSNVRTDASTARGQASTSSFSSLSNNRLLKGGSYLVQIQTLKKAARKSSRE